MQLISINDLTLIALELQPTINVSHRKAREAYLIQTGQTLAPDGITRQIHLLWIHH